MVSALSRHAAYRGAWLVHGTRPAAAAVGALSLVVLCAPLSPARADGQVFDSGHVDAFYVTAPEGQLTLGLKEDITGSGVTHPGDDVTLRVSEDAWNDATEGVSGIGTPTYYLPQTQDSALLWPGWDTQPAQSAGYTDVDFEFVEVTGPGDIFVFETAGFGDVQPVTNAGEMDLVSGDVINQAYPAHRHVNWAFTDPGVYTMTVQAVSNGDASNQVTYTWDVGDGEAAPRDNDAERSTEGSSEGTAQGTADSEFDSEDSAGADGAGAAGAADSAAQANGGSHAAGGTAHHSKNQQGKNNANKSAQKNSQEKTRRERGTRRNGSTAAPGEELAAAAETGSYDSGANLLPWGIGILGIGMLVLGLAVARLALAGRRE